MTENLNGFLVEMFGIPGLFCPGDKYIPQHIVEEGSDLRQYIILDVPDLMIDLDEETKHRFTGIAISKPEFFLSRPEYVNKGVTVVGVLFSFAKMISAQSDWQVVDCFNNSAMLDTSNPMTVDEFRENRILRFRSQHHSTCTMSALTDELLFGMLCIIVKSGRYVAKTFNHYNGSTKAHEVSTDRFYVEFSMDGTEEYSHIHLPYQYWGRLDVPVIERLSPMSQVYQPNISILLHKIDANIEEIIAGLFKFYAIW